MARVRGRRSYVWWGLVVSLCGCVSPGTDFDGLPFYRRDRIQRRVERDLERGPARETLSPITLGRAQASEEGVDEEGEEREPEHVDVDWPFPFVRYTRHGEDTSFQLLAGLPLIIPTNRLRTALFGADTRSRELPFTFYSINEVDEEDGSEDSDFGFFPLFVAGTDEEADEDYLAVAPFGGITKGLLGKDEALWVGFPYPLYLSWVDDEYESRHVLPPFVNWVNGGGHSGFRVWPLFGHYERVDEDGELAYERTWLLWPFVTWQTNGANLETTGPDGEPVDVPPTKVLAILPFYGHVHGPELHETDILYPFFRYSTFPRTEGWELRAPFPFVIVGANAEGESRYDFWPFFGIRQRPGYIRHFALVLERYERRDDEWVDDTYLTIVPFLKYRDFRDKKRENRDFFDLQVWPFFHHRVNQWGDTDTRALSVFPFENETVEEIFSPFFTLYRHRTIPEIGSSETSLLLNLVSWRTVRAPEGAGVEDYDRVSALFGLFQYRRRGRERALRFLYLADWPTWEAEG